MRVDTDKPESPRNWRLHKNQAGGVVDLKLVGDELYLDDKLVKLYRHFNPKEDVFELWEKMFEQTYLLGGAILDTLISSRSFPRAWRGEERIDFWGTTFLTPSETIYASDVSFFQETWRRGGSWITQGYQVGTRAVPIIEG